MTDMVNHPPHYTAHPSGVECIEITEHMGFCLGNAMKYIWRADLKVDAVEDLKKAIFYINRELEKRGTSKEKGVRETNRREPSSCNSVVVSTKQYKNDLKAGRISQTHY